MGSTTAPRPTSYFAPSPPSSTSVSEPSFIVARPRNTATSRTSVTSHYRPFSTYYHPGIEEPHHPLKRRRSSVFVSSATGLSSLGNMVFKHKDKDLDPPRPNSPAPRLRKDSDLTSSTRFKMPKTLRKKRSIAHSLASDVTVMPHTPTVLLSTSSSPSSSPASPTEEISPRPSPAIAEPEDDDDGEDSAKPPKYRKKDTWSRNDFGLKLHPYPKESPYPRAFDSIYLDVDMLNNELLQRLQPKNSPSFRDYGNAPPRSVIDLGCGSGFWLVEAAAAWKHTKFVGFDLVDVLQRDFQKIENVQFVRGNFVAYPLPFHDGSFDMVRMANLSLCIPYSKWEFVLSEVYRVLTVGGRLELIDDQLFFPYGEPPSAFPTTQHGPRKPHQGSFIDFDDEDDEESGESGSEEHSPVSLSSDLGSDPAETLVGDDESLSSSSSLKEHSPSPHVSVDLSPRDCPPPKDSCILQEPPEPTKPWNVAAAESRNLEVQFENMLASQHGIHPRAAEFVLDLMKGIFGTRLAGKMKSMHLKVAPTELSAEKKKTNIIPADLLKKLSINIEWGDKDKKKNRPRRNTLEEDSGSESRTSCDTCVSSSDSGQETVSAKAASMLGISMSEVSAASKEASARRPALNLDLPTSDLDQSGQSGGLLLWPRTFLPFSSADLEMHCCINIHTLLGCKAALADWIEDFVDEAGERVVSRAEFEDAIWSYECFRRRRFNWHTGLPSSKCPTTDSIKLPLKSTASSPDATDKTLEYPYGQNELTHVRTIRVFEGIKSLSRPPSAQ
ncbi:hypothetical protein IW261DRAFT_1563094 [Armillaria novae-zelandiae]|uniref:Methyltransferase domain-containing protein n=1 Tax=Armillaria novae-zelandiae TaxID=153914 RepID=A0AA39PCM8_9AGAR|nr:hypothetical protein IW261DRAFT_1563094 [Armillaria novae-zelandiae]